MVKGAAEAVQMLGLDGVYNIKRWLDATTHIAIEYVVYDNQPMCALMNLSGKIKRFDMVGKMLKAGQPPVSVEAKKYSSAGAQGQMYVEFLAIAYSSTAYEIENFGDSGREYMWVTYHPFAQGKWKSLSRKSAIREALDKHPEFLGGKPLDEEVVDLLASRLWVLVIHEKQHDLILRDDELKQVFSLIKREGS